MLSVKKVLGEPSTQGVGARLPRGMACSGSPVSAMSLGIEVRRLSTRPLASSNGDKTAGSASSQLRSVLLTVEPYLSGNGGIMDGGEAPVPCLLIYEVPACNSQSVTQYLRHHGLHGMHANQQFARVDDND